jgi:hypothetical protein
MGFLRKSSSSGENGAALFIVLAFVVLLTGLSVAYLSRTTSDRQVAQSSFHQSKADQLAASAMDLIIGDFQAEIANGSSPTPTVTPSVSPLPTPTASPFVYLPTAAANVVPVLWPTTTPGTTPIPNLIRISKRGDGPGGANPIPGPGVSSHASAVNSTNPSDVSANGRIVSLDRWNKHYLIPRPSPTPATNTSPIPDFSPSPDWVILTRNGPAAFSAWTAALADSTRTNNSYCVGRYAYAVYDEAGLLDANVAGFPSNTTAAQYGGKGVSAFADLTALGLSQADINAIVGWRNYFSAGPSGSFPNFNFNASAASNYVASVLSNTNGFMSVAVPASTPNNMSSTDQQFVTRQSLIQLLVNSGLGDAAAAAHALQYLGTFSRELNAPSWAPTLNASDMGGNNGTGNIYAYKDNAANPSATPINPNLLSVPVANQFVRADGTCSCGGGLPPCDSHQPCGASLINRRFPLTRLIAITPTGPNTTTNSTIVNGVLQPATITPNGGTIQRDFGLLWNSASNRWDYVGASGSTVQNAIERLDQVAGENREPNFFELLKAGILNGSLGLGSGADASHTRTFVAAEPKYYDNANAGGTSSDYQIIQIGANIVSQWDSSDTPIFIGFGTDPATLQPYELAGIKNLPYLSKVVFKPYWHKSGSTNLFDAWILPSLWNPHQNAPTPASQNVRVQMTLGTGTSVTVTTTAPSSSSLINATSFMTFSAPTFGPTPSGAGSVIVSQSSGNVTQSPDNYYGFHFPQITLPSAPSSSSTAYPGFGTSCTFEVQVQVNGSWKSYQKWNACAQPSTSLVYSNPSSNPQNDRNLQDPEFVALDPRTVRFGIWGNDASHSSTSPDYSNGTQYSLDSTLNSPSLPVELITTLPPQGSLFTLSTSPHSLYLYANNSSSTVHYTDLDLVQRLGDFPTAGNANDPADNQSQPTLSATRPLALCGAYPSPTPSGLQTGVFQSVAELGHVFRDQPWKTLNFTTAMPTTSTTSPRSADAGLLDLFTLHESSLEAGKTSLNTKQPLVLKAILSGAIKRLAGTSSDLITASQRDNIVAALTNLTASQPMVNTAELVTPISNTRISLVADGSVTGLGNKEARECILRAFSDAGQTRTWNLLIDLIAQSGRYPSNASSLAGFVVEGEQHYWVHVAIDRFTGQVIDKQIEVVTE